MIKSDKPLASDSPKFPPIQARYNSLRTSPSDGLRIWAKRLANVDPQDKEEAIRTILCDEYDTSVCTSFFAQLARREAARAAAATEIRERIEQSEQQDVQVKDPWHPKREKTMPVSSSDPRFPPINIRADVLSHILPADLIAWATHLGAKPAGKEEAILAILHLEYDEKTYQAWSELVSKGEQRYFARRQAVKQIVKKISNQEE